jgi:hypothetical protein
MAVKRYDGSAWQTVAGLGAQGPAATSSSIATWVKTASGGETSVSGNDDNSQSLSYTVGQELVFINGALQKRAVDYTATTGTSITGLNALAAGDVVTVWTVNAFSVTNAISNTLVDAKGDLIVATAADTPARLAVGSNDQVLTADSTTATGLKWSTITSGLPNATAYTPTTTNWTLGNGTLTTYYISTGDTVFFYGRILWGSTTSNTGQMRISLPVTAATIASNTYLISASGAFFDASTGTAYQLICTGPSTTQMGFNVINSNSTYVSSWAPIDSATPVAPTTNDEILFFSYYRKA